MMNDEIWKMDATALTQAYRVGTLSPSLVIDACFERISKLDADLNAFVFLSNSARQEARASALRWQAGAPIGLLDGVPVAVKDNLVVRDMPTTWGSAAFAARPFLKDELPLQRLRDAGAIIIGKTNTPEFAVEGYTSNKLFGPTRNPWAPRLTPGGSSGGSVTAVAAGMTPVALGTDGGGSTRRPAAYTGLIGFKPGMGHVPRGGGLPQVLRDFEEVGYFARTVRDIILFDQVLALPQGGSIAGKGTGTISILLVQRLGSNPCDPEILHSLQQAKGALAAMGQVIEEGVLPLDLTAINAIWPCIAEAGLCALVEQDAEVGRLAGERYLAMARRGADLSSNEMAEMDAIISELRSDADRMFEDHDVIMMPACAAMPWDADQPYPVNIDGQPVGARGHAVYTGWVNAAGLPAISLPSVPSTNGLPIGFQLIGRQGSEQLLLSLAAAFERQAPWNERWPACG